MQTAARRRQTEGDLIPWKPTRVLEEWSSVVKRHYFSLALCSLIKSVEMNLKSLAEQAGRASTGLPLGRLSLWSGATVMALRTVENLSCGCKQADGLESNGGPSKDASVCILRLRHNCIWSYCFSEKLVSRGLAMCLAAISS